MDYGASNLESIIESTIPQAAGKLIKGQPCCPKMNWHLCKLSMGKHDLFLLLLPPLVPTTYV